MNFLVRGCSKAEAGLEPGAFPCVSGRLPGGLTFALVAGVALAVAGGTFALIGPDRVDAVASRAQARHGLALVHICQGKGKAEN